jgi:homoserine trans-succinylase
LAVDRIFQSTEKRPKFWSTDYENFDQLKKHNFDQLIFGQTAPCQLLQFKFFIYFWAEKRSGKVGKHF